MYDRDEVPYPDTLAAARAQYAAQQPSSLNMPDLGEPLAAMPHMGLSPPMFPLGSPSPEFRLQPEPARGPVQRTGSVLPPAANHHGPLVADENDTAAYKQLLGLLSVFPVRTPSQ